MPAFGPVPQVAGLMRGFPHPWYIAGGWAVDLYLGRETREHDDIDVAILRKDQFELQRYLTDWAFVKVVDGQRLPWTDRERLDLPVHEVHATSRNRARIEFLLNESSGGTWQFRRNLLSRGNSITSGHRPPPAFRSSHPRLSCCSRRNPPRPRTRTILISSIPDWRTSRAAG